MKSVKSEIGRFAVGRDLASTHPELHHYTTFAGLKGITESNTLWATHFLDLNDSQEVVHLREPLTAVLNNVFREVLRTRQRESLRLRRIISNEGGLERTALTTAEAFVQTLYETTFGGMSSGPFAEPFITSFCSHGADQAYERENGLLSQWRGYGKDGGFCIVFDTAILSELLVQDEFKAYFYVHLNMGSAHYAVPDIPVETVFPDIPKFCGLYLNRMIDQKLEEAVELFTPFISGATLFKHQGFKEEREVRIVAMPGSQRLYAELNRQHPEQTARPLKTVLKGQGRAALSSLKAYPRSYRSNA